MSTNYQRDMPWRSDTPKLSGDYGQDRRVQESMIPQDIEIADTGTSGDLHEIEHQLGRMPQGAYVIHSQFTAPVGCYVESGDPAWTSRSIWLRFNQTNARVLLRVV